MEIKNTLIDSIDARTKLAGSNKMEILLFSLGTKEIFGINVFKVREVSKTPKITKAPYMPDGVEGVISLRGNIIPVINLARFAHLDSGYGSTPGIMIVTEYSRHTQGFLVHQVEHIVRVDWDMVKSPEDMLSGQEALITAITELPDGRLISILDVEQILANAYGEDINFNIDPINTGPHTVFFVDDSAVARKMIGGVLDQLSIHYHQANNGLDGWNKLDSLASRAQRSGENLRDLLQLILVDAEMPEMDGYVLTKQIKSDHRFQGIPIIMHSSLSSEANRAMGKNVGVDAYVAKFDPDILASTIRSTLNR
jgi:two-component system, chemotaxis family, chemotaxis protein CheV